MSATSDTRGHGTGGGVGRADVLVVFGISGNLAKVMTFRSLYRLEARGLLDCPVVGVAVDDWSDDDLREHARQAIVGSGEAIDDAVFARLAARMTYVSGDFGEALTYACVRTAIGDARTPVFYLEIPPFLFGTVVAGLASAGLTANARVIVEKPFGHDLVSAQALAAELHEVLEERQILRIDHFLGKMGLEELLFLRFANTMLEPVWNRNHVASVHVTLAERFGVEDRGSFYDPVGALRDVVVNHLLQVVAATAMEAPAGGDPETLKDMQLAVFRAMADADPRHYVRGQYEGYLDTPGVAPASTTETYAALRLDIDNWRWSGVPFFIRTGKHLALTQTEVRLVFAKAPRLGFGLHGERPEPNQLVVRLDPSTGVRLVVDARRADAPGPESITLDMRFADEGGEGPTPYEVLLHAALVGNTVRFTRQDGVEEQWRIMQPLLDAPPPAHPYAIGSMGPAEADALTRGHDGWRDPWGAVSAPDAGHQPSAERRRVESFGRLENGLRHAGEWYLWGPYLSERQWGTVREDYSPDGEAWSYLPHEHARSRAYRWGEDGLAGFSDIEQRLCLGLALWNERDPILKERIFGLTGPQGNHGEDAKEYWWYLDAVPSHSWNRWRYHYPQNAFPYEALVVENAARGKLDPEYELLDTGIFDHDRYWIVEADYAKDGPDELLLTIRVTNAGPEADVLHVLPTTWYRNTWAWELDAERPELRAVDGTVRTQHPFLGELELVADAGPDGAAPVPLFCDNETNTARLFGASDSPPFPKDGINDHVVSGSETVNPEQRGTKAAFWYRAEVAAGATIELRLRLRPTGRSDSPWSDFDEVVADRREEADAFYAELTPPRCSPDEALVMRQAFAGMLWSKQLYYYDVERWLDGDPVGPPPPAARHDGRNARWRSFDAFDIMSMPDTWEYPWFAAWDMAFHCVALAHVDPAFAKYQLTLLCREWFQHPNGALPAYEWSFDDVNPPVQAWAALQVFAIDGGRDVAFLGRIFDKLLVNFTWWVNRQDEDGSNVFEGGFLGLDNIGPIDRSHLPAGHTLEQSDATGWMASYALTMAAIASILNRHGRSATDLVVKFLEHFALISEAIREKDLWDDEDGFYYDQLRRPDGEIVPIRVRSMVGVLPLTAFAVIDEAVLGRALRVGKRFARLARRRQLDLERHAAEGHVLGEPGERRLLLGVVDVEHLLRVFERLFDEEAFLSPNGLRALSRWHREHPYTLAVDGMTTSIDYEPAESTTAMFGGNSNWRGPVWFPVNYLVVDALQRYSRYFGDELTLEYPTGSGTRLPLAEIAEDIRRRLISLFLADGSGRRPCFGQVEKMQTDPAWKDNLLFHEYFHGDNGAGLGASHQTGWTGIVADLIRRSGGAHIPTLAELMSGPVEEPPD